MNRIEKLPVQIQKADIVASHLLLNQESRTVPRGRSHRLSQLHAAADTRGDSEASSGIVRWFHDAFSGFIEKLHGTTDLSRSEHAMSRYGNPPLHEKPISYGLGADHAVGDQIIDRGTILLNQRTDVSPPNLEYPETEVGDLRVQRIRRLFPDYRVELRQVPICLTAVRSAEAEEVPDTFGELVSV